ncbi:hypothetical protein DGG96_05475 [Legionella qingyii]|uniref:Uncharacterized protein n=1 Tax=Legionella qingyii TaxID=2184757 RepID=A0A317U5P5_9GAMM|nr:hypothetical protein [Legionella qingyii]PWY56575.1 hypothetical protein DGG96_05475 [Legionella qingyii]RUR23389.1 hypothetical protein ELY20_07205 [Legionella qingyii]RUR26165.1 hypothetical protein ELY16_08470 [Legionella qingyii]
MATSSAILQSFLRDALKEKKELADLSFEELLNYNRAECGLIEINSLPKKFSDIALLTGSNNAIFLYEGTLYYAEKNTNQKDEIRKLEKPTKPKKPVATKDLKAKKEIGDPEYNEYIKELIQYRKKYTQYIIYKSKYDGLKQSCSQTYKRASGEELEWIRSLTGRAYTEHRSDDFLPSLNFYLGLLAKTDAVMFRYMDEDKKKALAFNLKITLLLLLAQQNHEIEYQKTENVKAYNQHIKRCSDFLNLLDSEYNKRVNQFLFQAKLASSDAQPIKYLGIPVGQLLGQGIADLSGGTTKTIKEYMGKLNEKRLSWVWDSSLLKTVIGLVPEDRFYAGQAAEAIKAPDPYTGTLSWALYYARFGLNLYLLLKHTIKHPWMSDEEAKTPWQERFQTQWSQRKFTLLNDSIWGTANLVCFFWLTGKGALGAAGDVVTIVLLAFDIAMAVWDFEEQRIKHNKAMKQYDEDIEQLVKRLAALQAIEKQQLSEDEKYEIRQVEIQLRTLRQERSRCERDWQLDKISLINNIAYAVGLMLAFVILTMPFMPIGAPVLATMVIVGAVLCFAFTVINNAIKGGIELYKTYKTRQEQIDQEKALTKDLKERFNTLSEDEKRLSFLEIKQCQAESEYQKQMMRYQSASLVRSIMIDALVPAVVFASLVFVPLGIGVPMIIAAVALAIATHCLVEALFKPEEKETSQIYELALMSELPDNDSKLALAGKIYLSDNGDYIVRDQNGTVRRGRLDATIDLSNLADRLNDLALKNSILDCTSKTGHTSLEFNEEEYKTFCNNLFEKPKVPKGFFGVKKGDAGEETESLLRNGAGSSNVCVWE